jgi:hypothetical protein
LKACSARIWAFADLEHTQERKYLVPLAFDVYGCPSKNTQLFLTTVGGGRGA